mmetsp:Transcript_56088/g.111324  ORF Transcript_56088/g.111324 Transcript_56088/m.111324 type:complete len:248 (-) Transcript_56088:808-1551(-)
MRVWIAGRRCCSSHRSSQSRRRPRARRWHLPSTCWHMSCPSTTSRSPRLSSSCQCCPTCPLSSCAPMARWPRANGFASSRRQWMRQRARQRWSSHTQTSRPSHLPSAPPPQTRLRIRVASPPAPLARRCRPPTDLVRSSRHSRRSRASLSSSTTTPRRRLMSSTANSLAPLPSSLNGLRCSWQLSMTRSVKPARWCSTRSRNSLPPSRPKCPMSSFESPRPSSSTTQAWSPTCNNSRSRSRLAGVIQ